MCFNLTNDSIEEVGEFATPEKVSMIREIGDLDETLGLPNIDTELGDVPELEVVSLNEETTVLDRILSLPNVTEVAANVAAEYVIRNLDKIFFDPYRMTEELLFRELT